MPHEIFVQANAQRRCLRVDALRGSEPNCFHERNGFVPRSDR
ncbi:hypothetical protein BSLA_03f0604 [Burkholderia stabilis]|nr:hypothetical protein BSLA_03f0604 [Burkholderia stabilis]